MFNSYNLSVRVDYKLTIFTNQELKLISKKIKAGTEMPAREGVPHTLPKRSICTAGFPAKLYPLLIPLLLTAEVDFLLEMNDPRGRVA